jgi:hypothetical protein
VMVTFGDQRGASGGIDGDRIEQVRKRENRVFRFLGIVGASVLKEWILG